MATTMLALVACGGDGDDAGDDAQTTEAAATETTAEGTESTGDEASGPVTDVGDVSDAVVQIVAQGSFVDPVEGELVNAAGAGSGFIIDPSGLAVTNNHVVTGAATLEVFVDGESRNARIVASSECSDLAVIQIADDDLAYLEWYEEPVEVALDVFAAGYPLGDPEFTLTRGIVSKASTDGETDFASVDSVIEHDATINPGNSGGPLVDDQGRVVAINYAGAPESGQYFAIGQETARAVIEQLVEGENVDWIGVNSQAITTADVSGIWVAAVESGSPAARAGLEAGDLITRMEGLVLATDGTKDDYCDVLRTRGDAPISIEVVRTETSEVLEGEINGEPLSQAFSFADELAEDAPDAGTGVVPAGGYDYVTVADDTGTLSLEVPTAWGDVNGVPVSDSTWDVRAAPDLEAYNDFYDVPGVQFTATVDPTFHDPTLDEVLDNITTWSESCDVIERADYGDVDYAGRYEYYTGCLDTAAGAIVVVARPPDGSHTVIVVVQITTEEDLVATDRILASFDVDLG